VIEDFSVLIGRNDRIGIIGPNGRGKSTLLNLLAGRIELDGGQIEWGPTVNIGYFAQENAELNHELRVIEIIKEVAEVIPTPDGGVITASQMLERFLFTPSQQWTPVGKLSGGEKRRLYLLQVLMGAPNVLFLDEPTNDLDIQTLSILEEYLEDFPGAVIAVSHDRYFLDRVAEKIFAFEGAGKIRSTVGNYTEYREQMEELGSGSPTQRSERDEGQPLVKDSKGLEHQGKIKERPLKMTFNEQREYEQIDDLIAQTEEELQKVSQDMNEASSDYGKLNELTKVQQAFETKLEEYMERWTYLNELAEKIAHSKV
jgi:ATP-binding cassette subfamily F protein uup